MEKKDRPYTVVPYDSTWTQNYEKEKLVLSNIFREKALSIEHIGSTSVEEMWAKPQIDILVTVSNLNKVDDLITTLQTKGYVYQKNFFTAHNEKYFTRDAPSGERLFSLHVLEKDDPEAISPIYFRDYLRTHPKARDLYSQVKRSAYKDKVDRVEYSKRKHDVLNKILTQAKQWSHRM